MQPECPEQPQLTPQRPRRRTLLCPPSSMLRLSVFMAGSLLSLAGCQQHRDFVDNTLEWTQRMRGGVIAAQRPPPPGQYDPYPHVGLAPTQAPEMPSVQARTLLTQRLVRDRNLTYRTVAANGSLTPVIPPPPNAVAAAGKATTLPDNAAGAVMDAADAPPPPPTLPNPVAPKPTATPTTNSTPKAAPPQTSTGTELAMPEVGEKAQKPPVPESAIPQIPEGPPEPPTFPGFSTPSDAHLISGPTPDYDLSDPKGTALHFVPQSDQLSSGQDATLNKIISQAPKGPFYIRGFGNAPSLSAQDQADAVQLGLLRAQRVAKALLSRNVPATAIHIRGDAFGTGARVATTP